MQWLRQGYNFIIVMQGKYHTIDPLILETLNLNEHRMNHILDILHGREPREYPKTERRHINKPFSKHKAISIISQEETILPPIPIVNRRVKQMQQRKQHNTPQTENLSARKSKTIQKSRTIQQNQTIQRIQQSQHTQKRYNYSFKSQTKAKHERTQQQPLNIEQQIMKLQTYKKEQLMKDYMLSKLKKSRSMQINPKDLYRIEIEHMVAQLTPIQQIEEAERKMQRIKKRFKHLYTFDKNYYSKLNQSELLKLS